MSNRLRSCLACQRHIRISETVCPFCQAPVPAARMTPPPRGTPAGRLGRAAAVATLAVGSLGTVAESAACGGETTPMVAAAYGLADNGDAQPDVTVYADAYGVAPFESGVDEDVIAADAADGGEPAADAEPDSVAKDDAEHEEDGGGD
jgi:hypothetical protein